MFEPLPDDEQMEQEPKRPAITRTHAAIAAVALSAFGFGSYAVHEHNIAARAVDQNAAISASLKNTNAQIEQLTAKLNDLTAPKPQPAEVAAPVAAKPKPARARKQVASHRTHRDDPRWKKVQSQLDEQGKAIASTQQNLDSARTELQGSIARTHGELVVLQKKGERRYYEFDIPKSKQFSPAGNMSVKLRKANVKHQFADLDLLVDDRTVTKKHVNLYEPTMFFTGDNEQPIQVVINSITKDHIHGYVSEPKYLKSELAAMQQQSDQSNSQATAAAPAKERQKLELNK
jgi:hypothetical protein